MYSRFVPCWEMGEMGDYSVMRVWQLKPGSFGSELE